MSKLSILSRLKSLTRVTHGNFHVLLKCWLWYRLRLGPVPKADRILCYKICRTHFQRLEVGDSLRCGEEQTDLDSFSTLGGGWGTFSFWRLRSNLSNTSQTQLTTSLGWKTILSSLKSPWIRLSSLSLSGKFFISHLESWSMAGMSRWAAAWYWLVQVDI